MASEGVHSSPSRPAGLRLVCAVPVPFIENGDLDVPGLPMLFSSLRAAGIRRVFVAGTTGEFTSLSDDERMRVIDEALEVFGPDGVYAHVGAATARDAVRLTRRAARSGVIRFAAITPYFLAAGPESVYGYYHRVAEELAGGELYVYVYQARATTDVSPRTLARLATIRGLVGAKLSGLRNAEVAPYVAAVPPDFRIFSGNDREIFGLEAIGASGLVSGVCSVFPALFVNAVAAINSGIAPGHYRDAISIAVDAVASGDIGLLKHGLSLLGLPAGPLRVSIDGPGPAAQAHLAQVLGEIGAPETVGG